MAPITERSRRVYDVTWSGSTDSEPVSLYGRTSGLRLYLPAGFAGSSITVLEEVGGSFVPVNVNGAPLSFLVTAGAVNVLHGAGDLFGAASMIFKSSISENVIGKLAGIA